MWSAFGTHAGSWHEDHRKALLWGRLDGAELILRTLRGTADQKVARISPLGIAAPTDEDESEKTRATALLQAALLAVLASEKPALTHLPDGFLDGLKSDVESIS